MKKTAFFSIILSCFLLPSPCFSQAQSIKTIQLTDGSILKGKVVELKDNMYTIEILSDWKGEAGEHVEPLKIPASSIASITSEQPHSEQPVPASNTEDLKNQAAVLQGKVMEDKELMGQVQQLTEQEEIKQLLSDPALMSDVISMDPERIQNNPNVQKLMSNPEMQKLMLQIQQKMPAQE